MATSFFASIRLQVRMLILRFVRLYQKILSPDHGVGRTLAPYRGCRFHPSCSEYAYQAIDKYGVIKGGIMALRRLFRCHPWQAGGHDPVP
ncbi:MAG: membrane protein insertion efficiency factor YidD [Patescibacteria group bacterium]